MNLETYIYVDGDTDHKIVCIVQVSMIPYFIEDDFGGHWITNEGIILADLSLYHQGVQRIAWQHLEENMWIDLYTPGIDHPPTMHVESHYQAQILGDICQAMDAIIHD